MGLTRLRTRPTAISPPSSPSVIAHPLCSAHDICCIVQEGTFEVSLAAEAWLEALHAHFGTAVLAALPQIAVAEAALRAAERAEDDLRRQYASNMAVLKTFVVAVVLAVSGLLHALMTVMLLKMGNLLSQRTHDGWPHNEVLQLHMAARSFS